MATTSLWAVQGSLGRLIHYVMNPKKTEEQYFVSGINCQPTKYAVDEMNAVKKQFGKTGGTVAFHGYQSFKPGEVDPETAHKIGMALATELWGERFQIIVTTHLDRGHIHNHIAINSVSFVDGIRFHRSNATYANMRKVSDRLCAEHSLSVIKEPAGKGKHYSEWKAEAEGKPTWRSIIRADVDEAISKAMTSKQFTLNLGAIGYDVKLGKDISVRPPGKERYVRLARSFGEAYTVDGINRRILENRHPRLAAPKNQPSNLAPKKLPPVFKGSIVSLYRHYLYLFGHYKKSGDSNARMHFLLREDIRHLRTIDYESRLLGREGIDTLAELHAYRDTLACEMDVLAEERKELRYVDKRTRTANSDIPKNPRIDEINARLKHLRKEVRHCESIEERSKALRRKIDTIEQEQTQEQEVEERGRNRTGGRPDNAPDAVRH